MSLDNLISKYLDSELSYEEDNELRELLADDPSLRKEFNSYIDIHLAIKEDASEIEVPDELYSQTEDLLMMKILQDIKPQAQEKKRKVFTLYNFAQFSSVAAVLLFVFMHNVDDSFIKDFGKSNLAQTQINNSNDAKAINTSNTNSNFTTNAQASNANDISNSSSVLILSEASDNARENSQADAMQSGNTSALAETQTENSNVDNVNIEMDSQNESSEVNLNLVKSSENSNLNFQENSPVPNAALGNFNSFDIDNIVQTDVMLTTLASNSFYHLGGIDNKAINSEEHYSQSLAYVINEESRWGVELGYTLLNYVSQTYISVPVGDVYTSKIEILDPNQSKFIKVPISINREHQIFWGSAFYERNLLQYDRVSLDARVGLGYSTDGLLTFGKLFTKVLLYNGLYLTIGTESRVYDAKLPLVNENEVRKNSSHSIIYGLQFKF